jgi:signal transduction histidine kinase
VTWRNETERPSVGAWEVIIAPVAPRTWLATTHLIVGAPIALAAGAVMIALLVLGVGTAITVLLIPVILVVMLLCSRMFAVVQRSRFAAFMDVRIPPPPAPRSGDTVIGRLVAEIRSPRAWRQVGFHLLSVVVETGGAVVVALCWSAALVFSTAFVYGEGLRALGVDVVPAENAYGWDLQSTDAQTLLTIVGVVLLFTTPWLARWIAQLDVAAAVGLLGPSRSEELTERVETLSESRAAVVAAADAERRRIERDLHDGAQQRLVALAMKLGLIRAMFPDLPKAAMDAVAEAHEEAKQALTELRDLVRGLHPAVLNDRGLDAALSGIAGRSPVPVRLTVDLPGRPPPAIEAVAYFVVSESLANVAKHSGASAAEVSVTRHGDRIRLVITDDGVGGVDPGGGTGLRGLTRRVASIDGTLTVDSPQGGPTTITVELPCAS